MNVMFKCNFYDGLSQWAGAYFQLDELSNEVRLYPGHQANVETTPNVSVEIKGK